MTDRRGTLIALAAVASTLLVVGTGVVVFALARADRTTQASAQRTERAASSEASISSEREAYRASWKRAYAAGVHQGEIEGRHAGAVAGHRRGSIVAARRAAAERTAHEHASHAESCVQIPGGPCEVPGPGAGGKACPSGSTPNADGGVVCVPESLVREAAEREASEKSPSVNSPEGQRVIEEEPECQAHPPPPGYEGPVQC